MKKLFLVLVLTVPPFTPLQADPEDPDMSAEAVSRPDPAKGVVDKDVTVQTASGPVDCSHAREDVTHLYYEKKSTDERKIKGVLSILPIGIAINAVSGVADHKENEQKEMQIDAYNQKLEDRINQIKSSCSE